MRCFCQSLCGETIYQLVGTVAEANFTHLVVYTASQLVEQTTPNASAISDTVAGSQEMVLPERSDARMITKKQRLW